MPSPSGTRLLALCTLAVAAVYAAGYAYTEPTVMGSGPVAAGAAGRTNQPAASESPRQAGPVAARYRDGTYTGVGSNPYGTLSVSVTIARGRITAVRITHYNMHYPSYFIDPQMNREVVQMQTWRVYVVSGATASSYNFAEAVYQALQKAKA
jgi:uncharacterized protein with FMN-binding domain